ncbi:RPB11 [Auxenochlorella protothecoides x Auxenochlorella symbiontica]
MSNQPDRYEKFVVPDGVKKVAFERDTKIANAGTFTVQREDHTIGNMIRTHLHEDPHVIFSGYKIPHPLEYRMLIKVQTDGRETPVAATQKAVDKLVEKVRSIREQFVAEVSRQDRPNDGRGY